MGTETSGEEMLKMFEQAKSLSKALGFQETAQETMDSQKLAQAMQMFQMLKGMNQQQEQQQEQKPEEHQRPEEKIEAAVHNGHRNEGPGYYDEGIHTPELQCLKAAIPYLEPAYRRRVGVFVKILELQKLMDMYTLEATSASGPGAAADWRRGMLGAIYPHMPREKKHMIEIIMKCIDINEIMGKMKEVNKKYGGKY